MIRRLAPSDADAILAIQSQCPELAPWSKHDYENMTAGNPIGWVAQLSLDAAATNSDSSAIIGFLTARIAADEMEILNLAVASEQRRRRTATALLRAAMDWGHANQARRVFLEVRASNVPAIRFYEKSSFQETGRRRNYYTSPPEDALQLAAQIR